MKVLTCPTCGGDLIVSGGARTLMGFAPSFDDEGRAHSHDPNWTTSHGWCAKDHHFKVSSQTPCPSGCGYGEDVEFTPIDRPATGVFW